MTVFGDATVRRYHGLLVTTAVDTITLAQAPRGVEVYNRGATDLWVTVNGADPTVGGANSDIVPAGTTYVVEADSDSANVVKLLGNGNAYSLKAQ